MPQLASSMMRKQVEEANIPDIPTMLELCMLEGVQFVACHMTMEMMKIKKEELIEGVTVMTAEQFLQQAADCQINMFT